MSKRFTKDPDATLDYLVDWNSWLPTGDTIASVMASAETGITVESTSLASNQHTIWLSGGSVGNEYAITSRVWTTNNRIDDRTFYIRVRER